MSTDAKRQPLPQYHQTAPGNVTHCLDCQTECQAPLLRVRVLPRGKEAHQHSRLDC